MRGNIKLSVLLFFLIQLPLLSIAEVISYPTEIIVEKSCLYDFGNVGKELRIKK